MCVLSIIVPIYNVEKYLKDCLESILVQTFNDFEIILVNDGSTDKSGEICDEYSKKDTRVKVIHKNNGGVSSARNIGLKNALGKYIAFVDPDDMIDKNMYEIMMNVSIKDDVDIVVCQIKTINTNLQTESISQIWEKANIKLNKIDIKKRLIPDILTKGQYSIASSSNKIYKINLLKGTNIRFNEEMSHGEDARFNLLLLQEAESIEFIDKPLYKYYIRDRISLTRAFDKNFYNRILDNKNFGIKLCKQYNITDITGYIETYMNNTINFIESLIRSDIDKNEKKEIVMNILQSNDFIDGINNYKPPSFYYHILKKTLISKNYMIINSVILVKWKIYNIYIRGQV